MGKWFLGTPIKSEKIKERNAQKDNIVSV